LCVSKNLLQTPLRTPSYLTKRVIAKHYEE
jgi:hypothetical protein